MSKPTLSPKFEKVNTPIQNAERNEQAIIQDVQKRLEAQKNAILGSSKVDESFLKDTYLLEVTSKIQNLVLDKSAFILNQNDILDDGAVVLYYTASDGKVYQSNPINDNLDNAQTLKDVMGTTLEWIGKQKMELLKQAGNKVTDAGLVADLQLYTSDPSAFLKAFVENNQKVLQMNDQIINEINTVKSEIMKSLGSVDDLEKEIVNFSGDAAVYAALLNKLIGAKQLREDQLGGLVGAAAITVKKEIDRLDVLLKTILPNKYIDVTTAKYVSPNTPKPDKDPHVLRDINHVLTIITEQLGSTSLSMQERHVLEQKQQDLQNVKEQFEVTAEEKEAMRLQERYEDTIEALTKNLRTISLERIIAQKTEYDKQKGELQQWYDKIDLKSDQVGEPTKSWLVDAKARFEGLENVFATYQARKPVYDEYKSLETQRDQILARGELNKKGEPKDRADRKEFKMIVEQLEAKGKQLEPLHAAVNKAEEDVGVLLVTPSSADQKQPEKSSDTTPEGAYKTPENNVSGFEDIPEGEKTKLVNQYFGKGAAVLGMDRWKMRCACNPRHQEFLIAYQKIALNDFMEGSRAKNLKNVVKERTQLNDAELGSVRDFRTLLKNLKNQKDDEKDRYIYAKKMIPCLFEWAYYEQFNKKTLGLVEAMEANRAGLPSAMQPIPSFACACEDTMIQIMSEQGMRGACCDMLSGIPGINAEYEMMNILKDCKVYKKMMKYIDPAALRDKRGSSIYPYFYPSNFPGSSADRPDMSNNTTSVYNAQTGKFDVIGNIADFRGWLGMYVHQRGAENVNPAGLETQKVIRDKAMAQKILHGWFDNKIDLASELANTKFDGKNLTSEQQKEIMSTLFEDGITKDDDLIYNIRQAYNDQLNMYWAAKEQAGGPIPNKDVNAIPEDVKRRIMSAASSEALAQFFPTMSGGHPRIKSCLEQIYGGGRDEHNFVNSSNEVVGRNIARIINERKGDPNYALSEMGVKDIFGSLPQFVDNIQANGLFGTMGNGLTMAMKSVGIPPELAQIVGSGAKTILPIIALIKGAQWGWNWLTKNKKGETDGFWSIVTKGLIGGTALMMFGGDLKALAVGGKGGHLTKWIYNRANKDKLYNSNEGFAPRQALEFVFGDLSMQQLHALVELDKGGNFVLKPALVKTIATMPGITQGGKDVLKSLLAESSGGINKMLHMGLNGLNITTMDQFNDIVSKNGNMSLREYAKNKTIADSDALKKSFPGLTPTEQQEIADHLGRLSEPDKLLFQERLKDAAAFAQTRNEIALILNDYKRPTALAALPNASVLSAGFAKKAEIQALRKQFLYGQAPFTNASKRADLEGEIAKLFNNDPQMSALLSSSTVLTDVESRGSSDLIADYNTTLSWEMGTTGKEELFMKNVGGTNVILSSRNVTTVGTSTESRLTFWIPNGSGKYEERQLDTVAGVSVNCTGAGVDANGEFYLSLPGTAEFTYTKKFLNTLVLEAKNNPMSTGGQLDTNDYNTTRMPNPKPAKYGISKTGTVRPS